ncbi:ABC transporter ATP-binding protein [Rivibacter subsaxonicus]|uniref:Dipeptide transport system ATP-binding protein n=1 Tax=Rivibacter subsaxonicus TaxID=457575 RepID=A0A4Q7VDA0_9BURK|nr:oligopeptide/dipeptide ABC transporter ATP-binding protein [Rivibacter subsaxonicus]RZT93887.1 dipeptide transport system ATP-binding protein [Rivibacter subsaxonicus]
MSLLEIRNLSVEFGSAERPFAAVQGLDLDLSQGELLGVVGESGSGKSVSMLALMGLIDAPGRVRADVMRFDGHDLLTLMPRERRQIVGRDIAMIFQDPVASLNPSFTVGFQIIETLKVHQRASKQQMRDRALELLQLVEIPDPASRLQAYPHQLSGGMSQRVMIAMALACKPKLLIADEPTTALDVTIQAQVLDLLVALQRRQDMALILITHDLALLAEHARRIAVMYAGEVVETQPVPALFERPHHPYTEALLASIPESSRGKSRLPTLPGVVPGQRQRPPGCLLAPRCPYAEAPCHATHPPLAPLPGGALVRCLLPRNLEAEATA